MERLTSDNPKNNIGNALNLFYVKDDWTWVRGGGPAPDYADISLTDFVRMLVRSNIPDNPELPADNDDLSAMMAEWLMGEPDTAEGIIALIYTAGWAFAELRARLAAYEDTGLTPEQIKNAQETLRCFDNIGIKRGNEIVTAEEQGRLVVLPCRPAGRPGAYGSDLYIVEDGEIIDETLWEVIVGENGIALCTFENSVYAAEELGKSVFLTREEAEAALRDKNVGDMGGKEDG